MATWLGQYQAAPLKAWLTAQPGMFGRPQGLPPATPPDTGIDPRRKDEMDALAREGNIKGLLEIARGTDTSAAERQYAEDLVYGSGGKLYAEAWGPKPDDSLLPPGMRWEQNPATGTWSMQWIRAGLDYPEPEGKRPVDRYGRPAAWNRHTGQYVKTLDWDQPKPALKMWAFPDGTTAWVDEANPWKMAIAQQRGGHRRTYGELQSGTFAPLVPRPEEAPTGPYGERAVWDEEKGEWVKPLGWGERPEGYVSPEEQEALDLARARLKQEQQQAEWSRQLEGARLAQEREKYLTGLQAAPRSWIQYWLETHPPVAQYPEGYQPIPQPAAVEEVRAALAGWGYPQSYTGGTEPYVRDIWEREARERAGLPPRPAPTYVQSLPEMPSWLSGVLEGGWGKMKLPSSTVWQRLAPSQHQGYLGYTDWLKMPQMDVESMMKQLWPQWASRRASWLPAAQG